jgi:hypothetical protein
MSKVTRSNATRAVKCNTKSDKKRQEKVTKTNQKNNTKGNKFAYNYRQGLGNGKPKTIC